MRSLAGRPKRNIEFLPLDAPSVEFAWGLARAWGRDASATKKTLFRARSATLVLLVFGAAAGAVGAVAAPDRHQAEWGVVAALALGLAGVLETFVVTPERARRWAAARLASEQLTAAVWMHLTRVAPYDGSDADRDEALRATVRRVATQTEGVRSTAPLAVPLPSPTDGDVVDLYRRKRAEDQLTYHRDNGAAEEKKGDYFRWMVLALTAGGAALVALSSITDVLGSSPLSAWVATLSAATGAVTTHMRAASYHEIAIGYDRTCMGLEHELHRFSQQPDQRADLPVFVANIEAILAHQNNSWVETIEG